MGNMANRTVNGENLFLKVQLLLDKLQYKTTNAELSNLETLDQLSSLLFVL